MNLVKIAARVAAGVDAVPEGGGADVGRSFYVDWDGPEYGRAKMERDLEIMKGALGEGPIFVGTSPSHTGGFFSDSKSVTNLEVLRGGNHGDDPDMEASVGRMTWIQFDNWDQVVEEYMLLETPDYGGTPFEGITVLLNDAVYEIAPGQVAQVEAAEDRSAKFYELAKHVGHPDDFEDIDIDLSVESGWEDLFGHAREISGG